MNGAFVHLVVPMATAAILDIGCNVLRHQTTTAFTASRCSCAVILR